MIKIKRKIGASNIIASTALMISLASIYFGVFYEDHDITVSIIGTDLEYSKKTINVTVLYHNQGNTYSTIVHDYLTFYQQGHWMTDGINFNEGFAFTNKYNSLILLPGEQSLREILCPTGFADKSKVQDKFDFNQPVMVGLVANYINDSGLGAVEMFPIGSIKVNEEGIIDHLKIEYQILRLDNKHSVPWGEISVTHSN